MNKFQTFCSSRHHLRMVATVVRDRSVSKKVAWKGKWSGDRIREMLCSHRLLVKVDPHHHKCHYTYRIRQLALHYRALSEWKYRHLVLHWVIILFDLTISVYWFQFTWKFLSRRHVTWPFFKWPVFYSKLYRYAVLAENVCFRLKKLFASAICDRTRTV